MSDIVYEKMESLGRDQSGKYKVNLLGTIEGRRAVFPYLLTEELMSFYAREQVLSGLFRESALKLIEQGTTRKD